MKAALYDQFGHPITIQDVADPTPDDDGVVIAVKATGICRSDWHGWMGHDPDISLPHVPGHELAGIIESVGKNVALWSPGDRVTLPFVCGCGSCPQCLSGNHQVCDQQVQPGFTHWGSFAEYVAIKHADINLVRLPDTIDFVTAASLGCRFTTAFRAVVAQGRVSPGEWVAVHGCGGVGLSSIMIAHALGAQVIGVDISHDALALAESIGATLTITAGPETEIVEIIKEVTDGGAHVSIDALGNPVTCFNSIACLRTRGRHVQVGLMLADHSRPEIPMDRVIAKELELYGSHGMQAYKFPELLHMILSGRLNPSLLIQKTVTLEEGIRELETMDDFHIHGVTVIDSF